MTFFEAEKGGIFISKTVKIAFSVAGGIIGAGFATGKELQLFFQNPTISSLCLLALSLILMALVSALYFSGQKRDLHNTWTATFIPPCFLMFSAASYLVMLACGGEALMESFQIPTPFGNVITCIITLLIVSFGVESVYRFNLIATPMLLIVILLIGCVGLWHPAGLFWERTEPVFDMLTYTGYNLLSILPFLAAISEETPKRNGIFGIFAGFFLVLIAGLLLKTLLNVYPIAVADATLPIVKIIDMISPRLSYLYTVMLYLSILTTAVNGLYAITRGKHTFLVSVALLGFSFFGFSNLINSLYPLFGYVGIGLVALILWETCIKKQS